MKILVLNCGSSSVKYQLIDMENQNALARGSVERIGMSASVMTHFRFDEPKRVFSREVLDHIQAIDLVIATLLSEEHGVISDKSEIHAVGHRVVHGGEEFTEPTLVTSEIMSRIRDLIELAPLHNPHNIRGINAASKNLPGIPQVAVFDTAFHHRMPPRAYMYGLPYQLYKKYSIRRYGFHGPSHQFVSQKGAELIGRPIEELKIITCHLGNGASMAAVKGGVSIDTSMGFTPLEGLMMGSRSGDCDPAIILHIMAREELSLHEANTLLNKHSGLYGISGLSSDVREILDAAADGRRNAILAAEVYCYRIKKYIGSYIAVLGGLDGFVFTGGVGQNAVEIRKRVIEGMEYLGLQLDGEKNEAYSEGDVIISSDDSKVKIMVIPTNEELVIALASEKILNQKGAVTT